MHNIGLENLGKNAIIEYLMKINECICGDIVNKLSLAQAIISQHLKELKKVEIIKGNIDGNSICYCIDEKTIEILSTYFSKIVETISKSKCC